MSENRWPGGSARPSAPGPPARSPEAARGRAPAPRPADGPPRELPMLPPDRVPAGAILLDSPRELRRRLRRNLGSAVGPLLALWWALAIMYFLTVGPMSILMLGLSALAAPDSSTTYLAYMGFTPTGLVLLFTLVPVLGTALSLAGFPLSALWTARLRPDRYLDEHRFQDDVAVRLALPLLAAPLAAVLLALILVLPFTPTVHWNALSPGTVATFCAAGLLLHVTYRALTRRFVAWRILGIDSAELVTHRAHTAATGAEQRRAAAFRAEDLRPNPPHGPYPPGLRLRAVRSLTQRLCRAPLITGAAVMTVIGWGTDILRGFAQLGALTSGGFGTTLAPTASPWPTLGLLVAGYGALAAVMAATAPSTVERASRHGLALAHSRHEAEERRRSYGIPLGSPAHPLLDAHLPETEAASRFLDRRGAVFDLVAIPVLIVITVVGGLIHWDALLALQTILLALVLLVARRSVREDEGGELLDVAYGPARRFVRRSVPHQLLAPPRGTRAQLAARQRNLGIDPGTVPADPASAATDAPRAEGPPDGAPPAGLPDFGRPDHGVRQWRPGPADPTEIPPHLRPPAS